MTKQKTSTKKNQWNARIFIRLWGISFFQQLRRPNSISQNTQTGHVVTLLNPTSPAGHTTHAKSQDQSRRQRKEENSRKKITQRAPVKHTTSHDQTATSRPPPNPLKTPLWDRNPRTILRSTARPPCGLAGPSYPPRRMPLGRHPRPPSGRSCK